MPDRIGRYEIIERIGRGGTGTVYKARDTRLSRLVALKVVSSEVELSDDLRTRFFSEAQSCAGLSHPNIVTIFDSDEQDDRLYVVMELLEGVELRRMLADRVELPIEEKVSVMMQLCDALAYAHDKGVVHRDIWPGNIFFQRTGPVKIIGFGIAKPGDSSPATGKNFSVGPLRYMAPEQVRGAADARSDQYSLAAVLYEMLGRRQPHLGDDANRLLEQLRTEEPPRLLDLDPTIPPDLVKIVARAMSKDPDARFPDLREMRTALEAVHLKFVAEAQRLRAELSTIVERIRDIDADLTSRLGGPPFDGAAIGTDAPAHAAALKRSIHLARERLDGLEECARRLGSAEKIVSHGKTALQAGNLPEAIRDFETVVANLPQFRAARLLLDRAQAEQETKRREEKARELLAEAARALEANDAVRCLALVQNAADLPPPFDAEEQIAGLRRDAKALQSEIEASRRAKQQAELARAQVVEARQLAESREAPGLASEKWAEANSKLEKADRAFASERFSESLLLFDAAGDAYVAADEEARDLREQQRRAADEKKNAERLERASKILDDARTSFRERDYGKCQELLRQIAEIPTPESLREEVVRLGRETDAALQNERQARKPAQQARMQMTALRVDAEAEGAPQRAAEIWNEAEAKAAAGGAALQRELFAEARTVFDEATALFRRALDQCRASSPAAEPQPSAAAAAVAGAASAAATPAMDAATPAASAPAAAADAAPDAKRREAERARDLVDEALRTSREHAQPSAAPELWMDLEAKIASARSAFESGAFEQSFREYEAALVLCQRFDDAARMASAGTKAAATDHAVPVVPLAPVIVPPTALPKDTRVAAKAAAAAAARDEAPKPGRNSTFAYGVVAIVVLSAGAAWLFQSRSRHFDTTVSTRTTTEASSSAPRIATEAEMAATLKAANEKTAVETPAGEKPADTRPVESAAPATGTPAAADKPVPGKPISPPNPNPSAQARAEAIAQAHAEYDAKAAADAAATQTSAEAARKAAEAKALEQARLDAEAKAREVAQAEAKTKAAQAKAEAAAKAKAEADAKTAKAKADAARAQLAKADAAANAARTKVDDKIDDVEPPVASSTGLTGAYAVVFTEGTDGKRAGGAWGACWRADPSAARSCAKSACDKTRRSNTPCQEIASTSPGGHCAVARAPGYGVSWGVCADSPAEARSGAVSGCHSQVKKNYGGAPATCEVVWTTKK